MRQIDPDIKLLMLTIALSTGIAVAIKYYTGSNHATGMFILFAMAVNSVIAMILLIAEFKKQRATNAETKIEEPSPSDLPEERICRPSSESVQRQRTLFKTLTEKSQGATNNTETDGSGAIDVFQMQEFDLK